MKHEIKHGPSYGLLTIDLGAGDRVVAEAGAMVTRDAGVEMSTRLNTGSKKAGFFAKFMGFFVAIFRKVFAGETMFINEFYPAEGSAGGHVALAPSLSGEIIHRTLNNERLLVQPGSFLASSPGLDMKVRWAGLRGLFGGEGAVFLEFSGSGDLWINAYGGIEEVEVNGSYIVDTGHMVAFDAGLDFKVKTPGGGLMGLFASGEGLVCEFKGQGKVLIQSRNLGALVGWLTGLLD